MEEIRFYSEVLNKIMSEKTGKESFTKDTYIPVISGDLYNIAVDHIDFFDINFLTNIVAFATLRDI